MVSPADGETRPEILSQALQGILPDHLRKDVAAQVLDLLEGRAPSREPQVEDAVRAVQAEDLDRMGKEDLRALIKDHDIVYVYHNVIDSIGDSPKTESEACLAVERALDQLEKLVRRLAGNNVSNMIITSDHGFLYQSHPIHEGDFSAASIDAPGVTHETQRFVLGRDLRGSEGLDLYSPKRAGLEGDVDILLPRSIARLGRKGKGSRFVHGGASLQEIVVPVITVNKARRDDIEEVEVEVIGAGSRIITTGQVTTALTAGSTTGSGISTRPELRSIRSAS